MPELRKKKGLFDNSITVDDECVAEIYEGKLQVNSYQDKYVFITPDEARAYCEIIAEWFGGTVTWDCSETSDTEEKCGGNGTADADGEDHGIEGWPGWVRLPDLPDGRERWMLFDDMSRNRARVTDGSWHVADASGFISGGAYSIDSVTARRDAVVSLKMQIAAVEVGDA